MTKPDYRALCANLAAALNDWQCETGDDRYEGLLGRARALLAEPPADGEVVELVEWLRENAEDERQLSNGDNPASLNLDRAADLLQHQYPQPVAGGPTIPNAKPHYLELTPCEVKRLIEALDFAIGDTVTRPNTGNHHAVRAKLKRSIPNALPTPEATNG